jgi:hypothetical protein
MKIRSLRELTTPDERALRFTPLGFSTSGVVRAEDATEHHQIHDKRLWLRLSVSSS